MPLIYKPRDPTIGQRKRRRKANKRIPISGSVLPETKAYIVSKRGEKSAGRLLDAAIKLHKELREREQSTKPAA